MTPAPRHGRAALLIALACAATFASSLPNAFHLDDFYRVVGNPGIERLTLRHFVDPSTMSTLPRITQYRPMLPLSLSINRAIGGQSPGSYRVGNLVIHAAASVLAYFVLFELLVLARRRRSLAAPEPAGGSTADPLEAKDASIALVAALLFAVHPVSGILVNYICSRDQSLMQAFLFGALLLYLRMRRTRFSVRGWAGALGLLLLSIASKTDGAVAPALVFVLEVTLGGERVRSKVPWLRALPFAVAAAALLGAVRFGLGFSDFEQVMSADPEMKWAFPLTQARLHLTYYAAHFFWPWPMRVDPEVELAKSFFEPGVLAGAAFIAASLVLAFLARRRAPLLTFAIVAYWLLLAPTSSILPFHHLAVDYRPYPGSPFFLLLCVQAGGAAIEFLGKKLAPRARHRLACSAAAIAVAWCAGWSVALSATWRDAESLWGHAIRQGGGALAHHNYGLAQSDLKKREHHFREALRRAPRYILAFLNLGRTLVSGGRVDEGLALCAHAVALGPDIGQTRYWYALTLSEVGRKAQAAAESEKATALEPRNALYRYQAAVDALAVTNAARALAHLDALRTLAPDFRDADYQRARALEGLGRRDEAMAAYRAQLAKEPAHAEARARLAALAPPTSR